jgi:hypothetical protein
MRVEAFRPAHLDRLRLQPAQAHFGAELLKPGYADMLRQGSSFSAVAGDDVLACAGVSEVWEGRAVAWALVSEAAGRHMLGIHRATAGFLAQAAYRRIEATVDEGFEAAHRWLRLLGFSCETPAGMRGFNPDGRNSFLYARVQWLDR